MIGKIYSKIPPDSKSRQIAREIVGMSGCKAFRDFIVGFRLMVCELDVLRFVRGNRANKKPSRNFLQAAQQPDSA
jgi:hypothetical protein